MRLAFLFLCMILFSSLGARPLETEVSARAAILINESTGAILYEKNSKVPLEPASVTKVATALYVLDVLGEKLDQMATVSADAMQMKPQRPGDYPSYWLEYDGTKMGIQRGEILSLEALMHGLMMKSGNDAANTIAELVSGSIPQFISELNEYVRLGCFDTRFLNPHGLSHPEHVTTAYDLSLIMKKAFQIPKFRELISKESFVLPKTNKRPKTEITTSNPFIKPGPHYYPKAIGGKTGFHSKAQNAFAVAAEHNGT